jgi:hypothetical protein
MIISRIALDCRRHLLRRRAVSEHVIGRVGKRQGKDVLLTAAMCLVEPLMAINLLPKYMASIIYYRILINGHLTATEYEMLASFEGWGGLDFDLDALFFPVLNSSDSNLSVGVDSKKIDVATLKEQQIFNAAILESRFVQFKKFSKGVCDYIGVGEKTRSSPVVEYGVHALGGKRAEILRQIQSMSRWKSYINLIFVFDEQGLADLEDAIGACSDPMALKLYDLHPRFFTQSLSLISANMVRLCMEERLSLTLYFLFRWFHGK